MSDSALSELIDYMEIVDEFRDALASKTTELSLSKKHSPRALLLGITTSIADWLTIAVGTHDSVRTASVRGLVWDEFLGYLDEKTLADLEEEIRRRRWKKVEKKSDP